MTKGIRNEVDCLVTVLIASVRPARDLCVVCGSVTRDVLCVCAHYLIPLKRSSPMAVSTLASHALISGIMGGGGSFFST